MESITELQVMPTMEHNEELGSYTYPEEFQHKLYTYKDQYVYIRENAYDVLPKHIIDILVKNIVPKIDTSIFATQQQLNGLLERIENFEHEMHSKITQLSENQNFENFVTHDDLNNIGANEETTVVLDTVNNRIDQLIDNFTKEIEQRPTFEMLETVQNRITQLQEVYQNMIKNEGSGLTEETVQNIILNELQVVYDNLEEIVAKKIPKNPVVSQTTSESNKVSLGTLVALKESGYTVEEIKQLREDSLI